MGAGENECQISQNYILHKKFSEFYLCFNSSCEFIFLDSHEKISFMLLQMTKYEWLSEKTGQNVNIVNGRGSTE